MYIKEKSIETQSYGRKLRVKFYIKYLTKTLIIDSENYELRKIHIYESELGNISSSAQSQISDCHLNEQQSYSESRIYRSAGTLEANFLFTSF